MLGAFQNCEKKNVSFDEDINSKLSGNGGGYDGKLVFYDLALNGECPSGEPVQGKITRLIENKVQKYYLVTESCQDRQPMLLPKEDVKEITAGSSASSLALIYKDRLFEQRNQQPVSVATIDNAVILACYFEQSEPGVALDLAQGALLLRENQQFAVINSYFLLYEHSSTGVDERVSVVDSALTSMNSGEYSSTSVASFKANHADGQIQAGFDQARGVMVHASGEVKFEGKGRQAASQRTLKGGTCLWKK